MGRSERELRVRNCLVCNHPERARIELLRVGGASLDSLAAKFDISRDAIWRHGAKHVSQERRAELTVGRSKIEELAETAADESKSLLDYLSITRSVLFHQFLTAAEAADRPAVANIASKLLEALIEYGKLTGELRQISGITVNNNTVNFIGTPEFGALSAGLLSIARQFPEIKAHIVALLRQLDSEPAIPKPNGAGQPMLIEGEVLQ